MLARSLSSSAVRSAMPAPFTCSLLARDGAEREIVYSQFAVDVVSGVTVGWIA